MVHLCAKVSFLDVKCMYMTLFCAAVMSYGHVPFERRCTGSSGYTLLSCVRRPFCCLEVDAQAGLGLQWSNMSYGSFVFGRRCAGWSGCTLVPYVIHWYNNCKKSRRLYGKITGNWLAAHLPLYFTGARWLFTGITSLDMTYPVSILHKSIAGRYRPVRVADGPITARYRFM